MKRWISIYGFLPYLRIFVARAMRLCAVVKALKLGARAKYIHENDYLLDVWSATETKEDLLHPVDGPMGRGAVTEDDDPLRR